MINGAKPVERNILYDREMFGEACGVSAMPSAFVAIAAMYSILMTEGERRSRNGRKRWQPGESVGRNGAAVYPLWRRGAVPMGRCARSTARPRTL